MGVANNLSGLTYKMNFLNIIVAAAILIVVFLLNEYLVENSFLIFASCLILVWNIISWILLLHKKDK